MLIWWASGSDARERERSAARLRIGDDTTRLAAILGPNGTVCPTGGLDHLRTRFPAGSSPAAVEATLIRMQSETTQRRVFPLDEDAPPGTTRCTPGSGDTEVGLDRRMRVLWMVPVTARTPLELPPGWIPRTDVAPAEKDDA